MYHDAVQLILGDGLSVCVSVSREKRKQEKSSKNEQESFNRDEEKRKKKSCKKEEFRGYWVAHNQACATYLQPVRLCDV